MFLIMYRGVYSTWFRFSFLFKVSISLETLTACTPSDSGVVVMDCHSPVCLGRGKQLVGGTCTM